MTFTISAAPTTGTRRVHASSLVSTALGHLNDPQNSNDALGAQFADQRSRITVAHRRNYLRRSVPFANHGIQRGAH